jgi:NDP-sugar pyrophosphorylase family protein
MKAMIFAAGLGTRLKPLTDTMPKALAEVGGKPILQHVIEKMKAEGFDEIIVNVHHFAEKIIDFLEANNRFGIRIEISDEREYLLDTGGGIKKASWFFDDDKPFLIYNVDILSNILLRELYEYHLNQNNLATLVCSERKTSRYLLFDRENALKGWINEKTGETKSPLTDFHPKAYQKLAFSGIHVLDTSVFSYMKDFPEKFTIIDFYLSICDQTIIKAYLPKRFELLDVGKLDALQKADEFIEKIKLTR